ncbi:MAG: DNA cytosine methyltransferase [Flavobacteriaceae bacterium]
MNKLKVVELFAGVGGFRIGLESTNNFEIIWSNQWEPSTKVQHASMVYENVFGSKGHSNKDIHEVKTEDIPDCDVLVGGFPCQDYSVATTLKNSKGLEGKKGVLWWQINRIIQEKKNKPKYLILENVDRLLKSPTSQRGRDFAIMLKCLELNDYTVEWRVINAAEYGFSQRRRRVFIIGYHKSTESYSKLKENPIDWLEYDGTMASGFPITNLENIKEVVIKNNSLVDISKKFNSKSTGKSPFENTGVMIDGRIITGKSTPNYSGKYTTLGDVILSSVEPEFYLDKIDADKWKYLKGPKSEPRKTKDGHVYKYSEGGMIFPDPLDKPSRTIITGEGGKSPSRFKHVIQTPKGKRRLTPIELERLNGFPDNHTKMSGISDTKRAFFMGNALICGIVEKIGDSLC